MQREVSNNDKKGMIDSLIIRSKQRSYGWKKISSIIEEQIRFEKLTSIYSIEQPEDHCERLI